MKIQFLLSVGAVGVVVSGCGRCSSVPKVAFRAADAVVVVNKATPKTKTGEYWYRDALVDLTNVMARVTGTVPAVYGSTATSSAASSPK